MEEIKYPEVKLEDVGYTETTEKCTRCGGNLVHGQAPCPEGRIGCLVIHYAYRCLKCGVDYK